MPCRVLLLLLAFPSDILSDQVPPSRTFIHPISLNPIPVAPNRVKPTAATVEFEPGVPPGWPSRSTMRPRQDPTTVPLVLNPDAHNGSPNRGFIDWLLGIVGLGGQGGTQSPESPGGAQTPTNCPKCSCGLTFQQKRIVGGVETLKNQYPWMVALMYNGRFYCGASVINNKYLLTAAHCVNGERLSAVFLDHDRSNHFETQTFTRTISKILRHKYYGSGGTYNNDIALLKLDKEIALDGLLKPVCLPELGKSFSGYKGVAVGWGAVKEHGTVSNVLREVQVPILTNSDCKKTGYAAKITDNMLCAGYSQGSKDACQGDSGGPLHIVSGTSHAIAGIVSWGDGCAQPNFPGVYTRVNRYISWIKSNTRDACYC